MSKFNVTKITKLVHLTKISVLCIADLRIFSEIKINTPGITRREFYGNFYYT